MAQLFQKLLAIRAIAQKIVANNDVIRFGLKTPDRIVGRARHLRIHHAEGAENGAHRRAHAWDIVDDEYPFFCEINIHDPYLK